MTVTVHPRVTASIGSTTAPVEGGSVTLDRKAVPYATAEITLPLTPDTALSDLDPRDSDRVTINAGNTGLWSPAWSPWVETRRNLALNPNGAGAGGFSTNNASVWTVTKNVPVPAPHPQGITTAVLSQNTGTVNRVVLSIYNIDALGNLATVRTAGAWFYTDTAGYEASGSAGGTYVPVPQNVWTWVAGVPVSGYAFAYVRKQSGAGNASPTDRAWITGVMATTDGPSTETIWGDRVPTYPDTEQYAWVGAANASASIYQTRHALTPVWTPDAARPFNLGIRERTINHQAKTVDIVLASDEAILQDYAPLGDDYTPFNLGGASLRQIVDYVLNNAFLGPLEPGPDADVTPYWAVTNEHRNPAVYATTLNWTAGGGGTLTWLANGATGVAVYTFSSTSGALYMVDTTKYNLNATPGEDYTVSVLARTTSATVTAQLVIRFRDNNGAIIVDARPEPAVTLNTAYQRLYGSVKAPANAVTIAPFIAFTNTASGRVVYLDSAMITKGDPNFYVPPFTGADAPGNGYTYAFEGPANDSPSVRTPVVERDPKLLVWEAGVSGWDFLQPLLTMANLRLWCDELRVWRLLEPAVLVTHGVLTVNGSNATFGSDTISREDSEVFCTGVLVRYTWIDSQTKQSRVAYDQAGTPDKTFVVDYDSPYPGPGAAAAILHRRNGTGRVMDVEGLARWSTSPGMETSVTMPNSLNQRGLASSVRFSLGDDALMTVGTVGLVEIPEDSWLDWPASQQWNQVPAGVTWASLP